MNSSRLSSRHFALHGTRVAIFVAVLLLIRLQATKQAKTVQSVPPNLQQVQAIWPSAANFSADDGLGFTVADEAGKMLGSVVQTFPESSHIIGFSGPTNMLVAFNNDEKVVGIDVLSSGDTRDHVKQVVEDTSFMAALNGSSREELATRSVDAVSGATLTSLAMLESIRFRVGGQASVGSLRFPEPLNVESVRSLFPAAVGVEKASESGPSWNVLGPNEAKLGTVLRSSPAADNVVGYQGPTDTLIGVGLEGSVQGIAIHGSFDNEPYVGYVRDESYFTTLHKGKSIGDLAALDVEQVEGVSGATMTSMAVTEGIQLAAADWQVRLKKSETTSSAALPLQANDIGTIALVLSGIVIGMTSLRSNRRIRIVFQLALVVYIGFIAGNLVSQAQLVGWARHGVPWRAAFGLAVLSAAAFAIPITTKRNVYCTHLCAHGTVQQLVRNRLPRGSSYRLPARFKRLLSSVPSLLLVWCVVVGMTSVGFSLVDIEPFDAYMFRIAGWATITIAVVGIVASLFVPMAYCRYGCPTGAVLQFLRFNAASDRWSNRDWAALGMLVLAAVLFLFG